MKRIVIQFNVTAKEKSDIARWAKRSGRSVSQWLRYVAVLHGTSK
jgi:hypothetical protein